MKRSKKALLIISAVFFGYSCKTDNNKANQECDPQIQVSWLNEGYEEIRKVAKDNPCADCTALAYNNFAICMANARGNMGMEMACKMALQADMKFCEQLCHGPLPPGQPTLIPRPPGHPTIIPTPTKP